MVRETIVPGKPSSRYSWVGPVLAAIPPLCDGPSPIYEIFLNSYHTGGVKQYELNVSVGITADTPLDYLDHTNLT